MIQLTIQKAMLLPIIVLLLGTRSRSQVSGLMSNVASKCTAPKIASMRRPHTTLYPLSGHPRAVTFRRPFLLTRNGRHATSTSLNLLLDVPDGFFAFTFPVLGILVSISKNFARVRMEERAWEQRLEEGREELLRRDPTLTELDIRRAQAAQEWSAYGVPRMQSENNERAYSDEPRDFGRGRRVATTLDRDDDNDKTPFRETTDRVRRGRVDDEMNTDELRRLKQQYTMTDEEIKAFELEFGIAYDPYYDDPYTVDELPPEKCEIDKLYGDRIYPNGEIFYRDGPTGLYYRQGSKPKNFSFFG